MHGNGFFNYARGFQTVEARAGHGGDDEAVYEAVGANDALFGRDDFALWTHQGRTHHAVGFRSVDARSEHGMPLEMADIVAVDYLFTLAGN